MAKYPSSDTGGEVGPDSTDGVPRGEVASGMATLIVGRDWESVVKY